MIKRTLILSVAVLTLASCQQPSSRPKVESPEPAPVVSVSPSEEAEAGLTGALQADVQLDKESYYPGDEIAVTAVAVGLSDTAWVGVVPSEVPHGKEADNDQADLGYVHLKDNPRLFLTAPKDAGDYDVRLNDDDFDGQEVASRSFRVESDPKPVAEAKIVWPPSSEVSSGAKVQIRFEAPLGYEDSAWVGIVPSSVPHGSEAEADPHNKGYEHLKGRSRGTVHLTLPSESGEYDIRMFDSDADGKEVASVSFKL